MIKIVFFFVLVVIICMLLLYIMFYVELFCEFCMVKLVLKIISKFFEFILFLNLGFNFFFYVWIILKYC